MTHTRYWAASLAAALCGAFIVIVRFAFDRGATPWIAFGVAIAATAFSLLAFAAAMQRDGQGFSGLSAIGALIGAWTIVAMLTLNAPAAGWVAFADGLALLAVSVRALALHEASVERVIYALDSHAQMQRSSAAEMNELAARSAGETMRRVNAAASVRSWASWLAAMSIALAGGFIVVMTFAMTKVGTSHVSPRWIAFGIAIAAAVVASGAVLDRGVLPRMRRTADWSDDGRLALLVLAALSVAVAAALVVTMAVYSGSTARWLAFALGCAMAGMGLLSAIVHEVSTERVRHELEIATPDRLGPAAPSAPASTAATL